jgi:hypothetical protein
MNRIFAVLATVVTILFSGCRDVQTESVATRRSSQAGATVRWKTFLSTQGKFSLLMPGVPEEKTSVSETQLGPLKNFLFIFREQQGKYKAAYLISYLDYPHDHTQKFKPSIFLERAWQETFGGSARIITYKKNIVLNGFVGIEFQYKGKTDPTIVTTSRNYLVKDRIYQLSAIMSQEQCDAGDAQKYLDSFQILK